MRAHGNIQSGMYFQELNNWNGDGMGRIMDKSEFNNIIAFQNICFHYQIGMKLRNRRYVLSLPNYVKQFYRSTEINRCTL